LWWDGTRIHTKRCEASNEAPKAKHFTVPTAELEACLQAADHRLVVNQETNRHLSVVGGKQGLQKGSRASSRGM